MELIEIQIQSPGPLSVVDRNNLTEIFNSLERALQGNISCDSQIYSKWILNNIFDVSKILGTPFGGFENSIHSILAELVENEEKKKNGPTAD